MIRLKLFFRFFYHIQNLNHLKYNIEYYFKFLLYNKQYKYKKKKMNNLNEYDLTIFKLYFFLKYLKINDNLFYLYLSLFLHTYFITIT